MIFLVALIPIPVAWRSQVFCIKDRVLTNAALLYVLLPVRLKRCAVTQNHISKRPESHVLALKAEY